MSRSQYSYGYNEDDGLWRGAVASAINGKRGQAFLSEMLTVLDAMSIKELGAQSLVTVDGEFCALGAIGQSRGLDMQKFDSDDFAALAKLFDIAPALAREIAHINDDVIPFSKVFTLEFHDSSHSFRIKKPSRTFTIKSIDITPKDIASRRWTHMRKWLISNIKTPEIHN